MSFLEGFFFLLLLKQEVGKHSQPRKAQFSLKLYQPPFGMSPGGPKQRPVYPYASPKSQRLTHLPSKGEE